MDSWSKCWTLGIEIHFGNLAVLSCCVLGQDSYLLQCLSPYRSINGYSQTARNTRQNLRGRGEHSIDWLPIQGEVIIPLIVSNY